MSNVTPLALPPDWECRRAVALLKEQREVLANTYADLAEVKQWAEDLKLSLIAHAIEQGEEVAENDIAALQACQSASITAGPTPVPVSANSCARHQRRLSQP